MLDEIRKGLMAGFGGIFLTKDKIEAATKKLVEDAKISREEAQKLTDELITLGDQRWTEMEKAVTEMARKGMDNLDFCRKSELESLEVKVEKLTERVAELERLERIKAD